MSRRKKVQLSSVNCYQQNATNQIFTIFLFKKYILYLFILYIYLFNLNLFIFYFLPISSNPKSHQPRWAISVSFKNSVFINKNQLQSQEI